MIYLDRKIDSSAAAAAAKRLLILEVIALRTQTRMVASQTCQFETEHLHTQNSR
jgi:hypothetical protein